MRNTTEGTIDLAQADNEVITRLIAQYSDNLIRFAYCYLKDSSAAEDVAEEAFATVIFKKKRFATHSAFKSYLYKVAHSRCIDALRLDKHTASIEDVENVLPAGNAEADVLKRETNRTVYCCMQKLPEQYCQVLYLNFFENFSVEEICKLLNKSQKQVYNLLSRAKSSLKVLLLKENFSYEDI